MAQPTSVLNFTGHQHFRIRLVLSILSGKNVRITKIRSEDKNPGLRGASDFLSQSIISVDIVMPDFEISLLRLLEKVTNGTAIEISVTGTNISFRNRRQTLPFIQVLPFC